MTNILFITHHYLNGNSGGCYASRAYINAFAANSKMTLLYPMKNGGEPEYISENIKKIPIWYNKSKIAKFLDLLCGHIHRYQHINEFIHNQKFDIVIFDTSLVSYHLIDYFRSKGCKTICIHHNYQYEYFRDNSRGILKFLNLFWCKRYEKEAVRKVDINITLTNQDKQLLSQKYGLGREVFVTTGIFEYCDNKRTIDNNKENASIKTFIITGSLGDMQTEFSICNWIDTYYPILKNEVKEHKIIIAGKNPSQRLYSKCKRITNITIIASPPDLKPILNEGDYYICPIEYGGGIKLRIMDGLKYGLPILTHKVSERGYDILKKYGLLYSYEDPYEFQQNLTRMINSNIPHERIINFYNNNFSFEVGVQKIKQVLDRIK